MQTTEKGSTSLFLSTLSLSFLFSVIVKGITIMLQKLIYFLFYALALKEICPYNSYRIPNDLL